MKGSCVLFLLNLKSKHVQFILAQIQKVERKAVLNEGDQFFVLLQACKTNPWGSKWPPFRPISPKISHQEKASPHPHPHPISPPNAPDQGNQHAKDAQQ
jgi:hypothetical protein